MAGFVAKATISGKPFKDPKPLPPVVRPATKVAAKAATKVTAKLPTQTAPASKRPAALASAPKPGGDKPKRKYSQNIGTPLVDIQGSRRRGRNPRMRPF